MNRRRRELLAALEPVAQKAMDRPAGNRPWSEAPGLAVRNEGSQRELLLYGRIGGGSWFEEGISASDVAAALRELGPGRVDVRINSGGGDVFDGVAIHSLLARHAGGVTVHIDGLAASAASFIAMAADRIVMARNGFMMIHDGMTMTYGNGNTHRSAGDLLDKVSDNIADMYAERAGEDVAHWRALMVENGEDGYWYTGQEALEAGLVDEITTAPGEDTEAHLLAGWRNVLPERIVATLAPPKPDEPDGPELPEDSPEPDVPAEEDTRDDEDEPIQDQQSRELAFALLADNLK